MIDFKSIHGMPYPKNKKQLQSMLGALNYYRLFVSGFSKIADPLYRLLKKNTKYEWGSEQAKAVDELKQRLGESPILKFPDFKKPFIIHTDASLTGIGACLMQIHKGILHPIAYVSKNLSETQRNYRIHNISPLAVALLTASSASFSYSVTN